MPRVWGPLVLQNEIVQAQVCEYGRPPRADATCTVWRDAHPDESAGGTSEPPARDRPHARAVRLRFAVILAGQVRGDSDAAAVHEHAIRPLRRLHHVDVYACLGEGEQRTAFARAVARWNGTRLDFSAARSQFERLAACYARSAGEAYDVYLRVRPDLIWLADLRLPPPPLLRSAIALRARILLTPETAVRAQQLAYNCDNAVRADATTRCSLLDDQIALVPAHLRAAYFEDNPRAPPHPGFRHNCPHPFWAKSVEGIITRRLEHAKAPVLIYPFPVVLATGRPGSLPPWYVRDNGVCGSPRAWGQTLLAAGGVTRAQLLQRNHTAFELNETQTTIHLCNTWRLMREEASPLAKRLCAGGRR
jgi:hypothetical protein